MTTQTVDAKTASLENVKLSPKSQTDRHTHIDKAQQVRQPDTHVDKAQQVRQPDTHMSTKPNKSDCQTHTHQLSPTSQTARHTDVD